MTSKEFSVEDIIQLTKKHLIASQLKKKTLSNYFATFRALVRFAEQKSLVFYTKALGNDFLMENFSTTLYEKGYHTPRVANAIRVVWMLNDLIDGKSIKFTYQHTPPPILSSCFYEVLTNYKRYYFCKSQSVHAWNLIERLLVKFFTFLSKRKIEDVESIGQQDIEAYFHSLETLSTMSKATERQRLKRFFSYLQQEKYISIDLSAFMPRIILYRKSTVPSIWSDSEIVSMLSKTDRSTPIGKRDYAIILLALQMGLRSADIGNLKLNNLHWSKNPSECTIEFIQNKTGVQFSQPMPYDVTCALGDYLKNGRPQTHDQHVFLRHGSHIGKLEKIGTRIYCVLKKTGCVIPYKKHGLHSLRHTFATKLVSNGTPLKIVSELMGHTSIVATGTYISVHTQALKKCALDPNEVI